MAPVTRDLAHLSVNIRLPARMQGFSVLGIPQK